MSKQTKAWAVVGHKGSLVAATGPKTNVQMALEKLTGKEWWQLESAGCKCIEVTITPTKETP